MPKASFHKDKEQKNKVEIKVAEVEGSRKRFKEISQNHNSVSILSESNCKRKRSMDSSLEKRRKQFYRESEWRPIQEAMFPTPVKDSPDAENDPMLAASSLVHSPGLKVRSMRPGVLQEINADAANSHYQFRNIFTKKLPCRPSPLPPLNWADSDELWRTMVEKDSVYHRSSAYLSRHSDLQPRMRAILLDWLMEVCEVYVLHRETFYLSIDYVDRYLTNTSNIHKTRLQLVGITALFIAAKLEEIYPPKLSDFAYVTDGACSEDEILSQELLMLSTLRWSLSPVTSISWLNVFLQTAHAEFSGESTNNATFFLPQYPQKTFVHIAQLLDLCALDIDSLNFPSGVLAAAALYHFSNREVATQVSGFHFKEIVACVQWMAPFAITVRDCGLKPMKQFRKVAECEYHTIQTHASRMDTLDLVYDNREKAQAKLQCQSPTEMGCFMTPPKSGQKTAASASPEDLR